MFRRSIIRVVQNKINRVNRIGSQQSVPVLIKYRRISHNIKKSNENITDRLREEEHEYSAVRNGQINTEDTEWSAKVKETEKQMHIAD